jgi:hypothetical protein
MDIIESYYKLVSLRQISNHENNIRFSLKVKEIEPLKSFKKDNGNKNKDDYRKKDNNYRKKDNNYRKKDKYKIKTTITEKTK